MNTTKLTGLGVVTLLAMPVVAWGQDSDLATPATTATYSDAYLPKATDRPLHGAIRTRRTDAIAPGFRVSDVRYEDRAGLAPADIGERAPLQPKPIAAADVAPKASAASVILAPYAGKEITPGNPEEDATMDIIQSRNRQEAFAAEQANEPASSHAVGNSSTQKQGLLPFAILIVIAVVFIVARKPYRQTRMGLHLSRMTTVLQEIELTRLTMPIGAGGGIDSLPKNRQIKADEIIKNGLTYLSKFNKIEITDALVKNMQLAELRSMNARYNSIAKLLDILIDRSLAMNLDEWKVLRKIL